MANLQLDSGLALSASALRSDVASSQVQPQEPVTGLATTANKQLVAAIDDQLRQQPLAQAMQQVNDVNSVQEAVEALNQSSTIRQTSLQFVFDERGEPPVVKVLDKDSGQEIRQIPSEVVQRIAKAIEEYADNSHNRSGILFDKQV